MVHYFQFVPLIRPRALERIFPKILRAGASVIMDLEDSIQDTLFPENTAELKNAARTGFEEIAAMGRYDLPKDRSFIRINPIGSSYYEDDIRMLARVRESIGFRGVMLPMVENTEQVAQCLSDLHRIGMSNTQIIPIVETVKGVDAIGEILERFCPNDIEFVQYGHFDYCLDAGIWPFIPQDSSKFWELATALIQMIEERGGKYIHTPFGKLQDKNLFIAVHKKLVGICRNGVQMAALNLDQTLIEPLTGVDIPLDRPFQFSESEKAALAKETIENFEQNRVKKRSFSSKDGIFIPPHEYWAAKRFLGIP